MALDIKIKLNESMSKICEFLENNLDVSSIKVVDNTISFDYEYLIEHEEGDLGGIVSFIVRITLDIGYFLKNTNNYINIHEDEDNDYKHPHINNSRTYLCLGTYASIIANLYDQFVEGKSIFNVEDYYIAVLSVYFKVLNEYNEDDAFPEGLPFCCSIPEQ